MRAIRAIDHHQVWHTGVTRCGTAGRDLIRRAADEPLDPDQLADWQRRLAQT